MKDMNLGEYTLGNDFLPFTSFVLLISQLYDIVFIVLRL